MLFLSNPNDMEGTNIMQENENIKNAMEKLEEVREKMEEKNADYFLIASLDDIAWLYNIRGSDVANNPVIIDVDGYKIHQLTSDITKKIKTVMENYERRLHHHIAYALYKRKNKQI